MSPRHYKDKAVYQKWSF